MIMAETGITKIGFLIFPDFPMACLTSMIEPLRAANEISGHKAFSWSLVSEGGGRVISSAQISFEADEVLAPDLLVDIMFMISGPTSRFQNEKYGNGIVRSLGRHGVILGAVSGGIFPLARTGIMERQPISVHWCYKAAFTAEFPKVNALDDVIVRTHNRYTMSGAAAAFDLALWLVQERLSSDISHEVACWFQHPMMRGEGVRQRVPKAQMPNTGAQLPDLVARSAEIFASNLEYTLTVAEVAEIAGVSTRQIERAFKKATGQSPSHYYRSLRMQAARQLVLYTNTKYDEVAQAVGYGSSALLATHYRAAYGHSPREEREKINQFRFEGNVPLPSS